ncbi:MAG: hypothetical protein EZS28_008963 [Streblomastix strix]|uniref:Uncharacterized protein n=1 Tax=Streblomastix strix TaxID=222440 RepID=A0A5J4WKP6_9EUKA|nr:MAG: hypothetical protein EZS28_008963 [Streblomastix strix]
MIFESFDDKCKSDWNQVDKRIPRSISQKHPPTHHFTMQTDQMDSEETVAGRSYRQQPTIMDTKTIRQSITLVMKIIMNKQMIIELEDDNKTTKPNINKIIDIINQEKKDHLMQFIPNKKQETQTLHNPKANHLQSLHLQKQAKQKEKLQYLNKGYNKPTNTILEAKQVNQTQYPISSQGVPKLEPTLALLTTSHPQQEQRKKADVALVTVDKSVKHSKGHKTSAESKKQTHGFNSDNQIEIEPDSETDQPDQLD